MLVKLDHETPRFGVKIPKIFELPPPSCSTGPLKINTNNTSEFLSWANGLFLSEPSEPRTTSSCPNLGVGKGWHGKAKRFWDLGMVKGGQVGGQRKKSQHLRKTSPTSRKLLSETPFHLRHPPVVFHHPHQPLVHQPLLPVARVTPCCNHYPLPKRRPWHHHCRKHSPRPWRTTRHWRWRSDSLQQLPPRREGLPSREHPRQHGLPIIHAPPPFGHDYWLWPGQWNSELSLNRHGDFKGQKGEGETLQQNQMGNEKHNWQSTKFSFGLLANLKLREYVV